MPLTVSLPPPLSHRLSQFLYELPFLESRPAASASASSNPDPFFVHITPDGIPIDEASTADFRRKDANRYSSETLRIRMARKALAAYGLGPPVDPSELSEVPVSMCVEVWVESVDKSELSVQAYGLGPPVDPSELSDIPVGTCVEWCGAMCRLSVN